MGGSVSPLSWKYVGAMGHAGLVRETKWSRSGKKRTTLSRNDPLDATRNRKQQRRASGCQTIRVDHGSQRPNQVYRDLVATDITRTRLLDVLRKPAECH